MSGGSRRIPPRRKSSAKRRLPPVDPGFSTIACSGVTSGASAAAARSWVSAWVQTITTSAPSSASPRSVVTRSRTTVPWTTPTAVRRRDWAMPAMFAANSGNSNRRTRLPCSVRSTETAFPPLPAPTTANRSIPSPLSFGWLSEQAVPVHAGRFPAGPAGPVDGASMRPSLTQAASSV